MLFVVLVRSYERITFTVVVIRRLLRNRLEKQQLRMIATVQELLLLLLILADRVH